MPIESKKSYEIFKSEVTGEALFGLAATLSLHSDRKNKWQTLAQLETQTKNAYLSQCTERPNYPWLSRMWGIIFGLVFAVLPWRISMRALQKGTEPLLARFTRLVEQSTVEDREFYRYVLAHEKAIAEFARMELQGSHNSLAPIIALLR